MTAVVNKMKSDTSLATKVSYLVAEINTIPKVSSVYKLPINILKRLQNKSISLISKDFFFLQ